MASPPTSGAGADRRSNAASPGRGGRGGGGGGGGARSQGRGGGSGGGRGRSNGKIIPNANVGRRNSNEGITSNSSDSSNGGRSHGGGRRHFSARGGGGGGAAGRSSKSGGRGSAAPTSLDQTVVADHSVEHSVEQEVKAMTDQDVLIAFGPFVRNGHAEATNIHKQYLSNSRQQEFINNARLFLIDQRSRTNVVDVIEDRCNNKQVAPHDVGAFSANDALPQDYTLTPRLMSEPPTGVLTQTTSDALGMEDRGDSSNANTSIPLPSVLSPPPGIVSIQPQQPVDQNSSLNKPSLPPGMPPPMRPVTAVDATPPPKTQPLSSILPARAQPQGATTTATPGKPPKARRTQTRCEEQPGRLLANQTPAAAFNNNQDTSIVARPRSQLVARWILPLSYLRNRALRRFEEKKALDGSTPQNLTIRDALKDLAVGLFRRGAMDSGSQSSIVTKEILASNDNGGQQQQQQQQGGRPPEDYFFNVDQKADSVFGEVPFYAPRTPGNVVFRLYFEDEPHVTLATGPCIHVIPADGDVDSVLRFILSNFKSKTSNGISSMASLASVFELFSTRQNERYFDAAGRVAWGCICESRKLVEQAGATYIRKKIELEAELEAERIKATLPDLSSLGFDDKTDSSDGPVENTKLEIKNEKSEASEAKSKLSLERYNNERKWREVQLVYASILKAALNNSTIHVLLKRELLSKMKLEYELWCPLTESFAPNPFAKLKDDNESQISIDLSSFPHSANALLKCQESRHNFQNEVLGFIPQSRPILPSAKQYRWKMNNRNLFKELSSAMTEIYQNEYAVSDQVMKRRENVRASIELIVSNSGEFPVGTKVVVFGSSANGFGSPNSDLDLCLQVPPSATNFTKEANGVEAMSNLATKLSEAGLTDVDTVRLTARIPIVKFNVPYNDDGKEILVECDLSLQNPLACLNTSLLNAYSAISPTTCVLASIIKSWAKNRGINNPSQYTLSSYGYVIMLIYFLTSCDFDKNGFVRENANAPSPILPNLQLVDPLWAQNPSLGPYRENAAKPKTLETMICHPTEANYFVNSYFYRSGLEGLKRFSSESHCANTATGALLASFFHYFAYDFDYSKRVVSLNTKHSAPPLEKEVKAEEDGWSLFRQGLAIEDPFELFYDVAHVVKASNFQHIRREFSLAYTKIVNAAYTDGDLPTGREIIDSICEPVEHEEE